MDEKITILGQTNFRNAQVKFGIKPDDRRRHMYIIGKTGMGKTELLKNIAISDIRAGNGIGVIDPHGEFAEGLLDYIPKERLDDVIYFNPSDADFPIAFNPLEQVSSEQRFLVASGIMGVFKKIWPDVWSARMEYILNNALLALLEYPNSTILGTMRLLSDKDYRKKIVDNLKDPVIKNFWVNEFSRYSQKFETEAVAAIQNKIGQLIANPLMRNILGQPHSTINLRGVMDGRKIFIADLSKGRIGEDNSALLGAMLITKLQLAAMSRADVPEAERKDFYLTVDEFQNFATDSFANILSEARKYRLNLIIGHQYIRQLVHDQNTKVRDAVFGNVGTLVSFRVGAEDAEFLEKEFTPNFLAADLINLDKYNVYIKLLIDGTAPRPFSAATLSAPPIPEEAFRDVIIENTRVKYATKRELVEKRIAEEWQSGGEVDEKIMRREERPLSQALRPGSAQAFRPGLTQAPQFRPAQMFRPGPAPAPQPTPAQALRPGSAPALPAKEPFQKPFLPRKDDRFSREKKHVNIGELREALSRSLNEKREELPPDGEKRSEERGAAGQPAANRSPRE